MLVSHSTLLEDCRQAHTPAFDTGKYASSSRTRSQPWPVSRSTTRTSSRASQQRLVLQRGGGHAILGERMRGGSAVAPQALQRPGRFKTERDGFEVKEVTVETSIGRPTPTGDEVEAFEVRLHPARLDGYVRRGERRLTGRAC